MSKVTKAECEKWLHATGAHFDYAKRIHDICCAALEARGSGADVQEAASGLSPDPAPDPDGKDGG